MSYAKCREPDSKGYNLNNFNYDASEMVKLQEQKTDQWSAGVGDKSMRSLFLEGDGAVHYLDFTGYCMTAWWSKLTKQYTKNVNFTVGKYGKLKT